ncbi:MAG: SPOR domain-containing protein [Gammaproteobacteria bacterium]|nr:SPOR domain-containing protein [Gammaproteobacteria bacterium]
MKWIGLSIVLLVAMTFMAGYILGFEKSNNKWLARLNPFEIALPAAVVTDQAALEVQVPEHEEPGASIDVDSADAEEAVVADYQIVEVDPVKAVQPVAVPLISEAVAQPAITVAEPEKVPAELGVGGPPQTRAEEPSLSEQAIESLGIVEDASEDSASHSIQVGMYRSFDNAVNKVEQLLSMDLNAYLHEYQNMNDETRYNVRFGYFSSFSSGQQALKIYQQDYSGSGYVVRLKR